MPMTREAKENSVAKLVDTLHRSTGGLVASYTGLNVESVNAIRAKFRSIEADYRVVKNTLMKRALDETGLTGLRDVFAGPTAAVFKYNDDLSLLGKTAQALEKDFPRFQVRAAFIATDVVTEEPLEVMAKLPTIQEVQAKLLGLIQTPAVQLVSLYNQPGQKLLAQINAPGDHVAGVLAAYKRKLEEAA